MHDLFADTIVMLFHYRAVGELFYIFHHGASIYAYYFVMVSEVIGAYHASFIFTIVRVCVSARMCVQFGLLMEDIN